MPPTAWCFGQTLAMLVALRRQVVMRLIATSILLLLGGVGSTAAQTAQCRLSPRPYGLGGICTLDSTQAAGRRLRIPFADSVRIWMASGPRDQPPWRGNISLPRLETSFEVVPEDMAASQGRLVLRTGIAWLVVKEWREFNVGPQECSACERTAKVVSLVVDLVTQPPATDTDVAILQSALAALEKGGRWNRQEEQQCSSTDEDTVGLFCLLYTAVESRVGRYHHRQPALELVRSVILERWRDRITSHQLIDFNNHPATTLADLRAALERALAQAQAQAQSERE